MTTPRETTPKDPNNPTTPNPPIPITIPLIPPFNLPTQLSQKLKIPHQPLLESMFYRISETITEMLDRIKYIF